VPPLRDRRDEILRLTEFFIAKYSQRYNRPVRSLSDALRQSFLSYEWPGNVRELENKVKTALIMAEGPMVTAEDLGLKEALDGGLLFNLKEVRTRAERQAIQQALAITDRNVSRTAELLGVSRPTLYDLMDKYGIRAPQ